MSKKLLEESVGKELLAQGLTIACAESCTGGLLTSRLTDIAGSSAYVMGSVVSYTNRIKESLVGVLPVLVYGAFYYGNILLNGVGERPYTNDWYGFTLFGEQFMPVVLAVMLLATWVFALAVRAGNAAVRKRQ